MFMQENKSNFQNKLTKESIFTALMLLMEKEDYSSITITQIAKKAGVSRMAYYRNYTSKEEIITDYFDYKFNKLFNKYFNKALVEDNFKFSQLILKYFTFFRKNKKLVENIIKANLKYILIKKFNEYFQVIYQNVMENNSMPDNVRSYSVYYITGGLSEVLVSWVSNGMLESSEEIAEIICKFTGEIW